MLVWYAQELQSSCVAACVRMVLGGLGAQGAKAQVRRLIYGIAAFVSAWEVAGRKALVIEAAPLTP